MTQQPHSSTPTSFNGAQQSGYQIGYVTLPTRNSWKMASGTHEVLVSPCRKFAWHIEEKRLFNLDQVRAVHVKPDWCNKLCPFGIRRGVHCYRSGVYRGVERGVVKYWVPGYGVQSGSVVELQN